MQQNAGCAAQVQNGLIPLGLTPQPTLGALVRHTAWAIHYKSQAVLLVLLAKPHASPLRGMPSHH